MRCPLCGGPLHLDDGDKFACERGHTLDGDELRSALSTRASTALWMAIEALETEAASLRILAEHSQSDGRSSEMADQAEADARLLRELTHAHASTDGGGR